MCTYAQHIHHVDPNKAAPKIMFPPCKSHTDCDKKQYCAIKCFTGGCGLESDVPQNTRGLFCQPCKKCEFLGSVTRTCKICKDSGGASMSLHAKHIHNFLCCFSFFYISDKQDVAHVRAYIIIEPFQRIPRFVFSYSIFSLLKIEDALKLSMNSNNYVCCADKVVRPDATRLYVPCNSHSHCVKNYFCAIECFEGGCGKDREVPPGTLGKYCQPCDHCKDDFNSITRSCHVCNELKSGHWLVRRVVCCVEFLFFYFKFFSLQLIRVMIKNQRMRRFV